MSDLIAKSSGLGNWIIDVTRFRGKEPQLVTYLVAIILVFVIYLWGAKLLNLVLSLFGYKQGLQVWNGQNHNSTHSQEALKPESASNFREPPSDNGAGKLANQYEDAMTLGYMAENTEREKAGLPQLTMDEFYHQWSVNRAELKDVPKTDYIAAKNTGLVTDAQLVQSANSQ